jgi:cytidylate kinase
MNNVDAIEIDVSKKSLEEVYQQLREHITKKSTNLH